uniref:Putative pectate lyase n=2 Tax=viral metagenome TaxID=1070528 RepID=A0A6M3J6Q6_9ZZZZ
MALIGFDVAPDAQQNLVALYEERHSGSLGLTDEQKAEAVIADVMKDQLLGLKQRQAQATVDGSGTSISVASNGSATTHAVIAPVGSGLAAFRANYLCTGDNDQNIINLAIITVANSGSGDVEFIAGKYYIKQGGLMSSGVATWTFSGYGVMNRPGVRLVGSWPGVEFIATGPESGPWHNAVIMMGDTRGDLGEMSVTNIKVNADNNWWYGIGIPDASAGTITIDAVACRNALSAGLMDYQSSATKNIRWSFFEDNVNRGVLLMNSWNAHIHGGAIRRNRLAGLHIGAWTGERGPGGNHIVDGIQISDNGSAATAGHDGVMVDDYQTGVTISNCHMLRNDEHGLYLRGTGHAVTGCHFIDNGSCGYRGSPNDSTIANCVASGNPNDGFRHSGDGTPLNGIGCSYSGDIAHHNGKHGFWTVGTGVHSVSYSNCQAHHNGELGDMLNGQGGFMAEYVGSPHICHVSYSGCHSWDNWGPGFWGESARHLSYSNCHAYDTGGGTQTQGIYTRWCDYTNITGGNIEGILHVAHGVHLIQENVMEVA